MKAIMHSIKAVVASHNALEHQASQLTDVFNDTLREHCEYYQHCECPVDGEEGDGTCRHDMNKLSACCMAMCPLDDTDEDDNTL